MALMRPVVSDEQLNSLNSRAEAKFYRACRDQLPNDVLVLHSTAWLATLPNGKLEEGEADFILAFSAGGILAVEVKGGGVSIDGKWNQWMSIDGERKTHKIKNPVEQAAKARYAIRRILNENARWKAWGTERKVIDGHAAFFPDIDDVEKLINSARPREILGARANLADLKSWVEQANGQWSKQVGTQPLGALGIRLIEEIFCGSVKVDPVRSSVRLFDMAEEIPPDHSWDSDLTAEKWETFSKRFAEQGLKSAPFELEKRDGAISLRREWNAQSRKAIWTKTFQRVTSSGLTEDLSFLCEWERELILRAKGVKGCAQLVDAFTEASAIHTGDTPPSSRRHSKTILRTYDAGPTLDVWQLMHPRADGFPQAHPFVDQRSFLQLMQAILRALKDFHSHGFVHCDLHPGNIALPAEIIRQNESTKRGEPLHVRPIWKELRLIDLDFSASNSIVPPFRLPHKLTSDGKSLRPISAHLRLRLVAIDAWLQSQGSAHLCYDREFWAAAENKQYLKCLQELDWREDLAQLGFWLGRIRDYWGGGPNVLTMGDTKEANLLITAFPEELMEWGGAREIDWDPERRTNSKAAPDVLPHDKYILGIERVLLRLGNRNPVETMVLYRHDYEPNYSIDDQSKQKTTEDSASLGQEVRPATTSTPSTVLWVAVVASAIVMSGGLILEMRKGSQVEAINPAVKHSSGGGGDGGSAGGPTSVARVPDPKGDSRGSAGRGSELSVEALGKARAAIAEPGAPVSTARSIPNVPDTLESRQEREISALTSIFDPAAYAIGAVVVGARASSRGDRLSELAARQVANKVVIGLRGKNLNSEEFRSSVYESKYFDALTQGKAEVLVSAGLLPKIRAAIVITASASCRDAVSTPGVTSCTITSNWRVFKASNNESVSTGLITTGAGGDADDAIERAAEFVVRDQLAIF